LHRDYGNALAEGSVVDDCISSRAIYISLFAYYSLVIIHRKHERLVFSRDSMYCDSVPSYGYNKKRSTGNLDSPSNVSRFIS